MTSAVRYVDTVWIFEKDQDKLDDTTPRYEGVILEYLHKIKVKNFVHDILTEVIIEKIMHKNNEITSCVYSNLKI